MKSFGFFIFWILSIFIILPLYSQNKPLRFEKITIEDGLSQSSVTDITKDNNGYMWFGTASGLNRYDGTGFTHFLKIPDDSTSLNSNFISCIYTDKDSVLWIGTNEEGISRYNREKENFETVRINSNDAALQNILSIYEHIDGSLYFGTQGGGIIRLNKNTGNTQILVSPAYPNRDAEANTIRDFFFYKNKLYLGSLAGIQTLDENGNFTKVTERPYEDLKYIKCFYQTKRGEVWIATDMGLGKLPENGDWNGIYYPYPELLDFFINDLVEDTDENMWVATTGHGLAFIDKGRERVDFYLKSFADSYSINNDDLISIYADNRGIIWIGGFGGGLNKYDKQKNKFDSYRDSYTDNITGLLEASDGGIWFVNGYSGVSRYVPDQNKTFNYFDKGYYFYRLCEDSYGNIWASHPHLGLSKFSASKQEFEFQIKTSVQKVMINGLDAKLYIGTNDGLKSLDPLTLKLEDVFSEQLLKTIYSTSRGLKDKLWFGGEEGKVVVYQVNDKKLKFYQLDYNGTTITERIPAILADSKGNLWASVPGKGLLFFDSNLGKGVKLLNEQDGLPNLEIVSMLEDDDGKIWLATLNGLAVLDPLTEKIKVYTTRDGLLNNEFNAQAAFKNPKGKLYFGGMEGFNFFFPGEIEENKLPPPVVFTGLKIFNRAVPIAANNPDEFSLPKAISLTKSIKLKHDQNTLTFEFAALNFSIPEKNNYAYKMEGFDQDWINSGTVHTANYTNLNPGKYIFRVKAANNDGVWNNSGTAMNLIIRPPYWETWWAYVIYSLIAVFLVSVIWQYNKNKTKLQNELQLKRMESQKLQEVDEIKTRFYTNVSHEFRTPLTLILGPIETALSLANGQKELKLNLEMVNRNAQRLLELINQLMDFSKLESGNMKLNAERDDVVKFLRTCTLSFSSLAVSKGINLQFETTAESLPTLFDKDKLEKIINNLLSNALKFTREGGSVIVSIDYSPTELILKVWDDGIGIPEDKVDSIFNRFYQVNNSSKTYEGTGIGLALLKELIAFHNGTIQVKSSEGNGSTFLIKIPVDILEIRKGSQPEKSVFYAGTLLENTSMQDDGFSESIESLTKPGNDEKEKPVVLIAEDNHEIRNYIAGAFERDYEVLEAENGKTALQLAIKNIPDLVISDIMMPVMDGQELCKALKTDEKTSHIPVILLTAKASQENKMEGLATGADDYLTKPFHLKELLARVKNMIEQRERLRKRFTRQVRLQPKEIAITSADENFLNRCMSVIEKNMSNSEFSVDEFGREVGMSRSQLHRKLKALIDQSASEFIRNIRLKRAAELVKNKYGNTAEVAYEVGFNSVSYFIRCYKEVYNQTPGEMVK